MKSFSSKKTRVSTRDRFISVLHSGSLPDFSSPPWYRQRGNIFTLIVIFLIFAMLFVVKKYEEGRKLRESQILNPHPGIEQIYPPDENSQEMSYEEAQKIFRKTAP